MNFYVSYSFLHINLWLKKIFFFIRCRWHLYFSCTYIYSSGPIKSVAIGENTAYITWDSTTVALFDPHFTTLHVRLYSRGGNDSYFASAMQNFNNRPPHKNRITTSASSQVVKMNHEN